MVYAIPCHGETHDLMKALIGRVPKYKEEDDSIGKYLLYYSKYSRKNRVVDFMDLFNKDGTQYAIENLVTLHG